MEAGRAACPPALLEALGLAVRGVRQEAGPSFLLSFPQWLPVPSTIRLEACTPVFSPTWLHVLLPRGLR